MEIKLEGRRGKRKNQINEERIQTGRKKTEAIKKDGKKEYSQYQLSIPSVIPCAHPQ
jgi:hypothetical protein